jgi:hypothetical protein
VFTAAAVGPVAMVGIKAAAAVVPSAATIPEAMSAPAVAITPTGPGAYAQEYPVVKVPRAVKAVGRALVGWSFIVAVRANRRRTADVNAQRNLRLSRWRRGQDQAHEQCRRTE